jgi:haloalkane dehalogenase
VLSSWDKPFLTAFSDSDAITRRGDKVFRKLVPGAADREHVTLEGGGHFLQEDIGQSFARVVADFIAATPRD